ncbi:hypothetical protein J6590_013027 [Homalodisca vitripennis]|nr:hypothetical protein J6590_013027 [Homalodisca vitripennis]
MMLNKLKILSLKLAPYILNLLHNRKIRVRILYRKKVHIFSDSHGRDLYEIVQPLVPKSDVFVNVCPGAPITYIMKNAADICADLTDKDVAVIIGGANDMNRVAYINHRAAQVIPKQIHTFCQKNNHTKFIVPMFPRYDLGTTHIINKQIAISNKKLKEMNSFGVTDNTQLGKQHFTRHGMHLNKMGKRLLARTIVQAIGSLTSNVPSGTSADPPALVSSESGQQTPPPGYIKSPSVTEISQMTLKITPQENTTSSPSTVNSCGSGRITPFPRQTTRPTSRENSLEELQQSSQSEPNVQLSESNQQTPLRGYSACLPPEESPGTSLLSSTLVNNSISSPVQGFNTPNTDKIILMQKLVNECNHVTREPQAENSYFLRKNKHHVTKP